MALNGCAKREERSRAVSAQALPGQSCHVCRPSPHSAARPAPHCALPLSSSASSSLAGCMSLSLGAPLRASLSRTSLRAPQHRARTMCSAAATSQRREIESDRCMGAPHALINSEFVGACHTADTRRCPRLLSSAGSSSMTAHVRAGAPRSLIPQHSLRSRQSDTELPGRSPPGVVTERLTSPSQPSHSHDIRADAQRLLAARRRPRPNQPLGLRRRRLPAHECRIDDV